jgi:hypothetical protein
MCRSIHTLFNFDPPATEEEILAASTQFVRKVAGFSRPSRANEAAFRHAIGAVASATTRLLESLATEAPPRSREMERARAQARARRRYGSA